eukprot:scaffold20605_cov19-Prasinocladus_malaysianus.AAC.2
MTRLLCGRLQPPSVLIGDDGYEYDTTQHCVTKTSWWTGDDFTPLANASQRTAISVNEQCDKQQPHESDRRRCKNATAKYWFMARTANNHTDLPPADRILQVNSSQCPITIPFLSNRATFAYCAAGEVSKTDI